MHPNSNAITDTTINSTANTTINSSTNTTINSTTNTTTSSTHNTTTNTTFISREYQTLTEMVSDMHRLGTQYCITDELVNTPRAHMLVCRSYASQCTARIIGLYDQSRNLFVIRLCELNHSCGPNQQEALLSEVSRDHNLSLRTGKLLEILLSKGFITNYENLHKTKLFLKSQKNDEQTSNNLSENYSNKLTDKLTDNQFDKLTDKQFDKQFIMAMEEFNNEFKELNPHCFTEISEKFFFFRQPDFTRKFRLPVELKIYERNGGYAIFVLQYDPSNEPLPQAVLVSDLPKRESIDAFVGAYRAALRAGFEQGSTSVERRYANFFVIDPDVELMEALETHGVDFFLKTRSVCAYLEEGRDDDPLSFQYFHECNYGTKEFLRVDRRRYLRKFCEYPLFNINNMPISDLEFITPALLALPFFEFLAAVIWHVAGIIATKKRGVCRESMGLPESISEMIEEMEGGEEGTVGPGVGNALCWCGKFQEFLIPCCHAAKWLRMNGSDPYYYVSSVYLVSNILDVRDLVPVISVKSDYWIQLHKKYKKILKNNGN